MRGERKGDAFSMCRIIIRISLRECYEWLAGRLARPLPPVTNEPSLRRRGQSNKRVSSAKLQALGWSPRYPTFQIAMAESVLPAAGL